MSRMIALIAALSILELGICSSSSMSENSSSTDMPANTESISETANAEQPARLIEEKDQEPVSVSKEKSDEAFVPPKALPGKRLEAKEDKFESESEGNNLKDEQEVREKAYMSADDSNPGAKVDPLLYYQAGCRFMKQKKFNLALQAFTKALELNPKYYEASYRKALVYQLTGYDKYAARRYQDVLKYRPDMDEARINLAALHRKHKHYSGAEEQLRLVIQHNWASWEAHYNLASVLVEANKPEEAMKEFKFCLKTRPNNPQVHNNLGVLFLQKNYPEEALQEFRKAAQLDPKNQTYVSNMKSTQKLIAEKKNKDLTM